VRKLKGGLFTGERLRETVKEGSGKRSVSVYGDSAMGTWMGGGSFIGDPEGYVKEWLWKRASFSTEAPLGDQGGDAALPWTL
jgi:hypothetical protein